MTSFHYSTRIQLWLAPIISNRVILHAVEGLGVMRNGFRLNFEFFGNSNPVIFIQDLPDEIPIPQQWKLLFAVERTIIYKVT